MGLFSKSQVDKINSIAKKSQEVNNVVPARSVSSINDELAASSAAVQEYFKDSPAILIQTDEELHEYVTKAIEAKYVGIDTETTGLDRNKDYIVGASLYYPGGVECYIPMKHRIPIFEDPYKNQLSYEVVAKEFQRFVDEKSRLIFANANYDLYMIWKDLKTSLDPACYYDVILAWRCLKEDELHNGLKELYNKYVLKGNGDPKRFSDFFSPKLFPYCKPEIAKLYAANDAKITYELFRWQVPFTIKSQKACQKNQLEHISDLIWKVEFPIISICQDIERTGMYIDNDTAKTLQNKYHAIDEKERAELVQLVQEVIDTHPVPYSAKKPPFTSGKDFNPRSTLHVKYLCYTLLGLKAKDGKEGTGEAILKEFNLPVTNKIVAIRSLATNISTFVDKLPNATSKDGKIHANFKQIGAACVTGDTIIATNLGDMKISEICEYGESYPEQFVDLSNSDIQVVNKLGQFEAIDAGIYYKHQLTKKLEIDGNYQLEGTFNHPIIARTSSTSYRAEFVELQNLQVGDLVQVVPNIEDLREEKLVWKEIISIETSVNDVYDLHVPGTHSFVSNGIISHNTGRLSSSEPNLMNIPSRLDDIRHMFRATPASYIEEKVDSNNGLKITLPKYYQLKVPEGQYVTIEKLNSGDSVILKNDNIEVVKTIESIDIESSEATIEFKVE